MRERRYLLVFAKEPLWGKVKTRLLAGLERPRTCIQLYKAFLKDTLELIGQTACENKVIAYDSGNQKPRYLKKIAGRRPFRFYRQRGRDLGEKMHHAFKFAERKNSAKTVIIGSDSPDLPAAVIDAAFEKLDRHDLVLGPSSDGGFYLIGLKKPCRGLFRGVPWGTERVLAKTLENAVPLKKRAILLDKWFDVDDVKSLRRLAGNLKNKKQAIAPNTREVLNDWLSTG